MKERKLRINIPKGYEIDKEKSTFEEIVFKKVNPLSDLPKTWEEYCKCEKRGSKQFYSDIGSSSFSGAYYEFPTKERVKQYIALGKLLQLRDYWVGDWKHNIPAFDDSVFAVFYNAILNEAQITNISYANLPLTFPTREMAQKFIDCFKDLVKEAYPLV